MNTVHVSKCRYCAQPGETMQSLAESFQTDWLQLWGANAHGTTCSLVAAIGAIVEFD